MNFKKTPFSLLGPVRKGPVTSPRHPNLKAIYDVAEWISESEY